MIGKKICFIGALGVLLFTFEFFHLKKIGPCSPELENLINKS